MTEFKTKEAPAPVLPQSPDAGIKALEKRTAFVPSLRERLDTPERFKERLKQLLDFLKNAHSAVHSVPVGNGKLQYLKVDDSYYLNVNLATALIEDLKNSRAPVPESDVAELIRLESYRNELVSKTTQMVSVYIRQ